MRRIWLIVIVFSLLLVACSPEGATESFAVSSATPIPPTPTLASPTTVPTPVPNVLWVDPSMPLGEISPYVYGSNYGPWVAVPADMLEAAYDSGTTILRFPGGEWGDANDLKEYQIDQFMAFAQQMGAEAFFNVRLREGSPEQAAELVRYVNVEQGYGVKYWGIGNEPGLYSGFMDHEYNTDEFNTQWREFAEAMKAVDPSILLVGPEIHQLTADESGNPKDSRGRDWMLEFLQANGDMVDVVSYHRYPFPSSRTSENASIEDLRQDAMSDWDDTVAYLRERIHAITGREIPIAITEANSHYSHAVGGEGTPDSYYQAIWWGSVLAKLIRSGVFMVNHFLLTSRISQGGWGLIGPGKVRPSYYTYQIYKQLGDRLLYSSSDDPQVIILAAERQDGALTILLINLSDVEIQKPLLVGEEAPQEAEMWLFDQSHNAEDLGLQPVLPDGLILSPQSLMLLVIAP